MPVHFVGGVHGAGKSTLCVRLQAVLGCDYAKASDLLRFESMPGDPTGKAVVDVKGNQHRLVAALERRMSPGRPLLLDGHYCVLHSQTRIVPVPLATFRSIEPLSLLLVQEDAETIRRRLGQRDAAAYSPALLEELLASEHAHAVAVASDLNVPLRAIGSDVDVKDLAAYLRGMERSSRGGT